LVQKCCGDDDECRDLLPCQTAKRMQQDDVAAACLEAIDDGASFPRCQLEPVAISQVAPDVYAVLSSWRIVSRRL
jgi:hypothetical protein